MCVLPVFVPDGFVDKKAVLKYTDAVLWAFVYTFWKKGSSVVKSDYSTRIKIWDLLRYIIQKLENNVVLGDSCLVKHWVDVLLIKEATLPCLIFRGMFDVIKLPKPRRNHRFIYSHGAFCRHPG